MVELAAHVLDEGAGEEVEEGEPRLLLELDAAGEEWVRDGWGGRLGHGDLPSVVGDGRYQPSSYHPGGSPLSPDMKFENLIPTSGLRNPIRMITFYDA
jgi:hypothetical protein